MTEHQNASAESLDLKPCPFCGSDDIMEGVYYAEGEAKKRDAVRCAVCGVRAPTASWQRRVTDVAQPTSELAARLRKSADHDGPQELKMVMRRIATALDRASQPSPAATVERPKSMWQLPEYDPERSLIDAVKEMASRAHSSAVSGHSHAPLECGRECEYYEYFEMLWNWFSDERRNGAEDMRANEANGGLSADDFKNMLDEHEAGLMMPDETMSNLARLIFEHECPGVRYTSEDAVVYRKAAQAALNELHAPIEPVAWRWRYLDREQWNLVPQEPPSEVSGGAIARQPLFTYAPIPNEPQAVRETDAYRDTVMKVSAAREKGYAAARANLQEAWAAMALIRETVETIGPIGAVPAAEHLDGPTFMHEAEAIVNGIQALALSRPHLARGGE